MLKELFDTIRTTAEQNADKRRPKAFTEFPWSKEDTHTAYVEVDGKLTPFDRPQPPRKHKVAMLDDLILAVKKFPGTHEADGFGVGPTVWVSYEAVHAVLDDRYGDSFVHCPLVETPLAKFVRSCNTATGRKFAQDELLQALRHDLRECPEAKELALAVKQVKFSANSAAEGIIDRSKESFGNVVTREAVMPQGGLPESLTIEGYLYVNDANPDEEAADGLVFAGCRLDLSLDVQVNLAEQRFVLKPLSGQFEEAVLNAAATLAKHLTEQLAAAAIVLRGSWA